MSQPVTELLSDQHKGIYKAQGILCYLFRHALLWRKVDQFSWNRRARVFFEKPHNKVHDKGNLNKTLTKDDFTWDAFKKAIDFLNAKKAILKIRLTWRDGRVSEYAIEIDPTENESERILIDSENNTWSDLRTISDTADSVIFKDRKKPKSTLARLFRRIITEEKINVVTWNKLFENYVTNPSHGFSQNHREINTTIGTLQRDLLMPNMSWNNFRKGMIILNPQQEDYILELSWTKPAVETSIHQVTIIDPLSVKPML